MKLSHLTKIVGGLALTVGLLGVPSVLPVVAQQNPDVPANNAPNYDSTPFQESEGVIDNYGWLGLIGLLGLLNLLRKPKPVASPPPIDQTSTTPRY